MSGKERIPDSIARDALYGLEVDGEVVDCYREGARDAEGEEGAGPDAAVGKNSGWDGCLVLKTDLDEYE